MTKRKTEQQVTEFFQGLVAADNSYKSRVEITVDKRPGRSPSYGVKLSDMYSDPLEFTFAQLKQVSEFFGTEKIDINRDSSPGCDTCDYGSSYEITLDIG